MKYGILRLAIVLTCLTSGSGVFAQSEQTLKLKAPDRWRSESVKLPPPFAPNVSLKGKAKVFFSRGWGKKNSDQFFTYAFVFQTEAEPKFGKNLIKKELLAYFGGLAARVSRGKVDPATFEMKVKEAKPDAETRQESEGNPDVDEGDSQEEGGSQEDGENLSDSKRFTAQLKWTEPFFTKAQQTLNMEVVAKFNEAENKNYLIVCVSPQDPKSKAGPSVNVWKQLRKVQASFIKPKKSEMPDKPSE